MKQVALVPHQIAAFSSVAPQSLSHIADTYEVVHLRGDISDALVEGALHVDRQHGLH